MKIDKLPPEDFFKVPDNYFDELPSQIIGAVKNENKIRRRRTLWMISSSVAATAILLFGIAFFFSKTNETIQPLTALDSVKIEQHETNASLAKLENVTITEPTPHLSEKLGINSQPSNPKIVNPQSISNNTNIELEPELDFCSLDNQIIDYYDDELARNEYYELK